MTICKIRTYSISFCRVCVLICIICNIICKNKCKTCKLICKSDFNVQDLQIVICPFSAYSAYVFPPHSLLCIPSPLPTLLMRVPVLLTGFSKNILEHVLCSDKSRGKRYYIVQLLGMQSDKTKALLQEV